MNNLSLDDLINIFREYNNNEDEINKIIDAYNYADYLHSGQLRQSGEPYIIHPLNVAYILADLHMDSDTICAGLLHDTLEDTDTTKEEIESKYNATISNLVDGVTKISKMNFSSKREQNDANTRKIILGLNNDVRIIFIKLADRLHNMRTLQYKTEYKQKENSVETLELFAPLANLVGAYRIQCELEDISFSYLNPSKYMTIEEERTKIEKNSEKIIEEMLYEIRSILNDNSISSEIKLRTKHIYGIYKRLREGNRTMLDIHDLLSLKIMVETIPDCYLTLGLIHSKYHSINNKFKDYIYNPKSNMYRSLHTTVFGPEYRLIQAQIRTFEMDKIASFGLATYCDLYKEKAQEKMVEELKNKLQFKSLLAINKTFIDNQDFVKHVKDELFSKKIYVQTASGETIELPEGSTVIDFAYLLGSKIGNSMIGAIVNDERVDVGTRLNNKDIVKIITDDVMYGPKKEWKDKVQTTAAKRKIKKYSSE